jgi:hypothetical protein
MDKDMRRSIALGSACAGFVTVPTLGPLLGGGEQARRYDTVITPPDYAFAVWAPIFAGCMANTIGQCRPSGRSRPASRRTGWPLAGAYAANALWSVAAQTKFALTPVLLPVATGFAAAAHVRLQQVPDATRAAPINVLSTGLLLGWTALASTVNLAAGALVLGAERTSPRMVATSTAGLLAASGGLAAAVAASRNGSIPLAVASGWGLSTTALARSRPLGVRVAAAAGVVLIAAGAAWRTAMNRRHGPAGK